MPFPYFHSLIALQVLLLALLLSTASFAQKHITTDHLSSASPLTLRYYVMAAEENSPSSITLSDLRALEEANPNSARAKIFLATALLDRNTVKLCKARDQEAIAKLDAAVSQAQQNNDSTTLLTAYVALFAAHTLGAGNPGRQITAISRRRAEHTQDLIKGLVGNSDSKISEQLSKTIPSTYSIHDFGRLNR